MRKTTRELLERLPDYVRKNVEDFRSSYTKTKDYHRQAETRTRMAGYVLGLRDGGLITERERQILFIYMTI